MSCPLLALSADVSLNRLCLGEPGPACGLRTAVTLCVDIYIIDCDAGSD